MAQPAILRVRTHALRQVVVLEFAGRLGGVIQDLDKAVQLALADGPRGVVCDLSAVLEGAEPDAVELLATAGRHVRDWPGIPVVVAGSKRRVREALRFHPLGGQLIVTASVHQAVSAVLATPIPLVEWQRLAPHPTAPRASRNFVARTLLDWGLGRLIPSASLVVSELVTNSTIDAGTDIELSLAWDQEALRLTVRDNSPDLPRQRFSRFDQHGRGLSVVVALSRAFGVLPTADGKVVWAVLNAARPT
ncbi:MAG TPA: ATP-binding protein [Dermatophilaceae bacterium]